MADEAVVAAARGRPPRISRRAIARAALDIGLPCVTLTGIADRLGVDHSSLYRHVSGRRDILIAAANLALADLDWRSSTSDWRTYMEKLVQAVWALYERHPGLADVIRDLDVNPPEGVRAFAEAAGRLQEFGFPMPDAILLLDSAIGMTGASFAGWEGSSRRSSSVRTVGENMLQAWNDEAKQNADAAPLIMAMQALLGGDPKTWWRHKIAMLFDGAALRLVAKHKTLAVTGKAHP